VSLLVKGILIGILGLLAEVSGATVSGKVEDQDHRPIGQHPIVIRNKTTGASFYAVTDHQGSYYFANLEPGSYVLSSVKSSAIQLEIAISPNVGTITVQPLLVNLAPSLRLAAEAHETGEHFRDGQTKYVFTLWLDAPQSLVDTIATVEYRLVYKQNPLRLFGDAKDVERPFSNKYTGWGCYENVSATIEYKNKKVETKRFDLCASLGWN
jgi:Carboxypeptidase regulatory-like domain